jgi:osmoprotectant transport system substrate-binding protein
MSDTPAGAEGGIDMRRPVISLAATLVAALLLVVGCTGTSRNAAPRPAAGATSGETVVVGAFNFSESEILAHLFAGALNGAGLHATVRGLSTRELVQPALWAGEVQVVPEYTSTLTAFLNAHDRVAGAKQPGHDLRGTMIALRAAARRHHLVVLNPSAAANQNVFAVTSEFAQENHLSSLSDLARYRGPLVLGGPAECPTRPYCAPGLQKVYGIQVTGFRRLDPGGPLTKLALKTGQIQLGLLFSSDPGIRAYGLRVLDDDKHLQDVDVVVPVVHQAAASPRLTAAVNKVMAVLTTSELMKLNAEADLQHVDPAAVAKAYLTSKGLG